MPTRAAQRVQDYLIDDEVPSEASGGSETNLENERNENEGKEL